jgi:hypothetical protein
MFGDKVTGNRYSKRYRRRRAVNGDVRIGSTASGRTSTEIISTVAKAHLQ